MTVAELIQDVLAQVRNHFYADRPPREFKRDERALMQAIARYGYECDRRHWQFDAMFIYQDITAVLRTMREKQAAIKYLPVYLEGAVDRHIRVRAEELSAQAKKLPPRVSKVLAGVQTAVLVEATATETLAALYRDLKQRRRKPAAVKLKQETLFNGRMRDGGQR
jgi:hypothetical protein